MSVLMTLNVALAGLNALLALVVSAVYARNHKEIRSPFTLSLLLFAAFFLLHNIVLLYHYLTMMVDTVAVSEALLLVEGILQLGALSALTYATLR